MFSRSKSRRSRAGDFLSRYLKLNAAGKGAKAAEWTAYAEAAKDTVKRAPRAWIAVAGGLGAAAFAARKRRGATGGTPPAPA